jgi:hypothetical protein
MTINLYRSFHLRAQVLKKKLGHGFGIEAWEQAEKEYNEKNGKNRYTTYDSFRACHCKFIEDLKIRKH